MRLRATNPALAEARSVFPYRVIPVKEVKRLLQPVDGNRKIGGGHLIVTKGKWRGMPCFSLTLEERATCPTDCQQWANCYGNNMRFAPRVDHRNPLALMTALEAELREKTRLYRKILVRLHVLGDFFSLPYAQFWLQMLKALPGLHIFGFTHWSRESEIGQVMQQMNEVDGRCWMRFSDAGGEMSANVEGEGIQCPEQTGKTHSCMTCGICWGTTKAVSFKEH